jgi:MFS transporter, MHS family, proline/betaine transporter
MSTHTSPASSAGSGGPPPSDGRLTRAQRKALLAGTIGNTVEWVDWALYSIFVKVISEVFFPKAEGAVALLSTLAVFAVGFVVRPVGAAVLGAYADRHGRKKGLTLTVGLMAGASFVIALTPGYGAIGVAAPVVLLVARLLQGFSAGGEFGSATTFLVETAPHRKAYYASWQVASQGISMFLASAFGYVLFNQLSKEDLYSWGWRIPFVIGCLIGPVGLYIRARLSEPKEFTDSTPNEAPIRATFTEHLGRVLTGSACVGVATISVYLILFMPTYAVKNLGVPASAAYLGGVVAGIVTMVGVPLVGRLADRVGPARVMVWAAVGALVLAWPLFAIVIASPTVPVLVVSIGLLGVIMAFYFGPLPALLTTLFPSDVRATGVSVAYNVGVTVMGGIAPLVLTWLIGLTGSLNAPSVYYMVVAVVSLVGLTVARRRYGAA